MNELMNAPELNGAKETVKEEVPLFSCTLTFNVVVDVDFSAYGGASRFFEIVQSKNDSIRNHFIDYLGKFDFIDVDYDPDDAISTSYCISESTNVDLGSSFKYSIEYYCNFSSYSDISDFHIVVACYWEEIKKHIISFFSLQGFVINAENEISSDYSLNFSFDTRRF